MKFRIALAAMMICGLVGLRLVGDDAKKDAAKDEKKFECKCVVSGAPAKEASSVEHHGKKVYFCCDNCPKAFAKDPGKFSVKVHEQWVKTGEIVQVACPLTGAKINPEATLEVGANKVSFCCMNCLGKAKAAEGDAQTKLVYGNIEKGYTLQNKCPVSGQPIDPASSVTYKGKKVYFCCENCPKAFEKEPAKFEAKLPQLKEAKKEKESK